MFGALDWFVSEPDKKGGDSPESVKGWGSLCFGDKCGTEVNSPSVARADPWEQSKGYWISPSIRSGCYFKSN